MKKQMNWLCLFLLIISAHHCGIINMDELKVLQRPINYGQQHELDWPFKRIRNFSNIIIEPNSEFFLLTLAKSSYSIKFFVESNLSVSSDLNFLVQPNYNYLKNRNISECKNKGRSGTYRSYCCDTKIEKNKEVLENCSLVYWSFDINVNSSSFVSPTVWYNRISYINQALDIVNLFAVVLGALRIKERPSRFYNAINYIVAIQNNANTSIEISNLTIHENSDRRRPVTYLFFSIFVFSRFGIFLFVFVYAPIIFFLCIFCCIFGNVTLLRKKLNEKGVQSVYSIWKNDKKGFFKSHCLGFLKYLVHNQSHLELICLIFDKFRKNKYENCAKLFENEEKYEHNFYFLKKIFHFICIFGVSFFTSLILENYIMESVSIPGECALNSLLYEPGKYQINNIDLYFSPQAIGDSYGYFKNGTAFLYDGKIEKNPNVLSNEYPFESYYEKLLYSEFSFLECQVETMVVNDSRPLCNSTDENLGIWLRRPYLDNGQSYVCNNVKNLFNFIFYWVVSTIFAFIILSIPLYFFDNSFWWKAGPFCFGNCCCKNTIKSNKENIKNFKSKNCCSGFCFFISTIVFIYCLISILYYYSLFKIEWEGIVIGFISCFIVEFLYEFFTIFIKYFFLCGFKNYFNYTMSEKAKELHMNEMKKKKDKVEIIEQNLNEEETNEIKVVEEKTIKEEEEVKNEKEVINNIEIKKEGIVGNNV